MRPKYLGSSFFSTKGIQINDILYNSGENLADILGCFGRTGKLFNLDHFFLIFAN